MRGRDLRDDVQPGEDPGYARVPDRLVEQLEAGEISLAGFALRVFLIRRTNYRTGRYTTTIGALLEQLAWPWGREHLRKELKKLEPDFRAESGKGRDRWVIHVLADDFGLEPAALPTDLQRETPSALEVTSNGHGSRKAAIAAAERVREQSEPPTGASPQPSTAQPSSASGTAPAKPGASRATDAAENERQNAARAANGFEAAGELADGLGAASSLSRDYEMGQPCHFCPAVGARGELEADGWTVVKIDGWSRWACPRCATTAIAITKTSPSQERGAPAA